MATVLRNAGYSTFWVGKNHNTPVDAWTMGSSKKDWPLGLGYDRFYGFSRSSPRSSSPRYRRE
jgi:arylsulfatase A-like enzyme